MVSDAYAKYKDNFPGHNPILIYKRMNADFRILERRSRVEIIRIYE
jgi:hypothetical protein